MSSPRWPCRREPSSPRSSPRDDRLALHEADQLSMPKASNLSLGEQAELAQHRGQVAVESPSSPRRFTGTSRCVSSPFRRDRAAQSCSRSASQQAPAHCGSRLSATRRSRLQRRPAPPHAASDSPSGPSGRKPVSSYSTARWRHESIRRGRCRCRHRGSRRLRPIRPWGRVRPVGAGQAWHGDS